MARQKILTWVYEGPVNLYGKCHSIDFHAYTLARTEEEARRNVIWQYKIRFCLPKTANITLDGIIYKSIRTVHIATKKKKKENDIKYDYEQLEMDL